MIHCILNFDISSCFANYDSKFKLVIDSVVLTDGKMDLLRHVIDRGPGFSKDYGDFWYLFHTHLFDVFEVVLSDSQDFWKRFCCVGLV